MRFAPNAYSLLPTVPCVYDVVSQLVIPKFHGEKLADIPDEHLSEILVCSGLPKPLTQPRGRLSDLAVPPSRLRSALSRPRAPRTTMCCRTTAAMPTSKWIMLVALPPGPTKAPRPLWRKRMLTKLLQVHFHMVRQAS